MKAKFTLLSGISLFLFAVTPTFADTSSAVDEISEQDAITILEILDSLERTTGTPVGECGQAEAPSCNGTCGEGDKCMPNFGHSGRSRTDPECKCIKQDQAKCENYDEFAGNQGQFCQYGLCPEGQECKSTTTKGARPRTTCGCVKKTAPTPPTQGGSGGTQQGGETPAVPPTNPGQGGGTGTSDIVNKAGDAAKLWQIIRLITRR